MSSGNDQLNVEYVFRLIYNCLHSACSGSVDTSQAAAWFAHLWLFIIAIGYIVAVIALIIIMYSTMRLFELRKREETFYTTLLVRPSEFGGANPRWLHVESLIAGTSTSDWRQAIIEADIMLDDFLMIKGYIGAGVGEKLRSVDSKDLATLNDAWEAHKVRNQIAHEGSHFDLSETLARRTIAHYEAVFRELDVL